MKTYTQRYYASYDREKGHVTGWYDIESLSHTNNVPDEDDLIKLTDDEWKNRKCNGHGVKDGKIVDHVQNNPVPLTEQASYALRNARTFVQNNFILLGETPSQEWIDYQKALIAIVNGTDTTATALPTEPATS